MSSTNCECLLSPPCISSDAGVKCSATQCGFRVLLSYDEIKAGAFFKSLMGPGKPYEKSPPGSTGLTASFAAFPYGIGAGGGGDDDDLEGVVLCVVVVEIVVTDCGCVSLRSAKAAAAPTAADAPATIAMVIFDMVNVMCMMMGGTVAKRCLCRRLLLHISDIMRRQSRTTFEAPGACHFHRCRPIIKLAQTPARLLAYISA